MATETKHCDDGPEMPLLTKKLDGERQAANRLGHKTQDVLGEMWQEVCQKGVSLSFRIVSGSMSPMIEVDDVVRVSRVKPSKIRIGDIVAFRSGQNVVVHRVIWKRRKGQHIRFRQIGDNCRTSGRFVAQNLIGRVTVIYKDGHEIRLDSTRRVIRNSIIGWRRLLFDVLSRRLGRGIRKNLRKVSRTARRL